MNGNLYRIEEWEYPLEVIRELIVNSIVHRDYTQSSDTVIKIFDDKIEIFNPGKLPEGITIKKILSGEYNSIIRNKKIADIFKEIGLIEKYGSGLKRVIESISQTKRHIIKFSETEAGFKVILIRTPVKTPVKENIILSAIENKILIEIRNDIKITYEKLSEKINVGTDTIKEYIRKLKNKEALKRIGSKRSGYWEINGYY